MGGFLGDASGWRWLYYIQIILAGICWLVLTFTVPETYAPVLLDRRAKKLRKETGDPRYVTEKDLDPRPMSEQMRIFLFRPLQLLSMEPIVLLSWNPCHVTTASGSDLFTGAAPSCALPYIRSVSLWCRYLLA